MNMENEKSEKNKKFNRPARIKPRNKQSYSQYVWIRNMFLRIDRIDARLDNVEEFLKSLGYDNRKVYKEENKQLSNERNTP
jgi:hypothetical protein